jgi:hypothetical protein
LRRLREEQPKREKPLPHFATWLTVHNTREGYSGDTGGAF